MPEHGMSAFEGRFERRMQAFADITVAPVDSDAVARTVVGARRTRSR